MNEIAETRQSILEKVKLVREQREEEKKGCAHEFSRVKEPIRTDNIRFRGEAYFTKDICTKCGEKRLVDYTVVR